MRSAATTSATARVTQRDPGRGVDSGPGPDGSRAPYPVDDELVDDELVDDELLVEEISIDGMCGVY